MAGKKKTKHIDVRLDDELYAQAERKARSRGWPLAAVIRALVRLWVVEDLVGPDDVGAERQSAPKPGSGRRPRKKP